MNIKFSELTHPYNARGAQVGPRRRPVLVGEVTDHGDADGVGDRHGELGEPPRPGKVPCADLLVDVHLEAVTVAAVEDAVDPHEDHVPAVAVHRAEGHHRDPGEEEGHLVAT